MSFLGYIIESGQVKADLKMTRAVIEWPTPIPWKQLQRFLEIANFYPRFIHNFSRVAATITPEAEQAFSHLKNLFTSAPVLVQPDPSLQFVVEVDACDTGVGAVLFQRSCPDRKLQPCMFFSHRLSAAERYYDVGNRTASCQDGPGGLA